MGKSFQVSVNQKADHTQPYNTTYSTLDTVIRLLMRHNNSKYLSGKVNQTVTSKKQRHTRKLPNLIA